MNVHVPGQDIEEGVSPILRVEHIANESITSTLGLAVFLDVFVFSPSWALGQL